MIEAGESTKGSKGKRGMVTEANEVNKGRRDGFSRKEAVCDHQSTTGALIGFKETSMLALLQSPCGLDHAYLNLVSVFHFQTENVGQQDVRQATI
jgi:hypothetical protein